jgi:hypothetical protein
MLVFQDGSSGILGRSSSCEVELYPRLSCRKGSMRLVDPVADAGWPQSLVKHCHGSRGSWLAVRPPRSREASMQPTGSKATSPPGPSTCASCHLALFPFPAEALPWAWNCFGATVFPPSKPPSLPLPR